MFFFFLRIQESKNPRIQIQESKNPRIQESRIQESKNPSRLPESRIQNWESKILAYRSPESKSKNPKFSLTRVQNPNPRIQNSRLPEPRIQNPESKYLAYQSSRNQESKNPKGNIFVKILWRAMTFWVLLRLFFFCFISFLFCFIWVRSKLKKCKTKKFETQKVTANIYLLGVGFSGRRIRKHYG